MKKQCWLIFTADENMELCVDVKIRNVNNINNDKKPEHYTTFHNLGICYVEYTMYYHKDRGELQQYISVRIRPEKNIKTAENPIIKT